MRAFLQVNRAGTSEGKSPASSPSCVLVHCVSQTALLVLHKLPFLITFLGYKKTLPLIFTLSIHIKVRLLSLFRIHPRTSLFSFIHFPFASLRPLDPCSCHLVDITCPRWSPASRASCCINRPLLPPAARASPVFHCPSLFLRSSFPLSAASSVSSVSGSHAQIIGGSYPAVHTFQLKRYAITSNIISMSTAFFGIQRFTYLVKVFSLSFSHILFAVSFFPLLSCSPISPSGYVF